MGEVKHRWAGTYYMQILTVYMSSTLVIIGNGFFFYLDNNFRTFKIKLNR